MDQINHLKTVLQTASKSRILDLLSKAHTTIGHLNGRHIHVQGYAGHVTFTDFLKRIEEVYQKEIAPMHVHVDKYAQMSDQEERIFSEAFNWREEVDTLVAKRLGESQNEVDQIASMNFLGRIQKSWDGFLNSRSCTQNVCTAQDQESFSRLKVIKIENTLKEHLIK